MFAQLKRGTVYLLCAYLSGAMYHYSDTVAR
jgi:hypothetical protein